MAIRDSSNENSTNGSNTSKVGQSIMGSKKTVAKTEELYSDNLELIRKESSQYLYQNLLPLI